MLRGKCLKRLVSVILLGILFIQPCIEPISQVSAATDLTLDEYEDLSTSYAVDDSIPRYEDYLQNCDSNRPEDEIVIDAADYVRVDGMDATEYTDYEGMSGTSVYTEDDGFIEYEVTVSEAGLYEVSMVYYPVEGKNTEIQRSLFVDGELPYSELSLIELSRIWVNETKEWQTDNQGNDLKPEQIEELDWITTYLYDSDGYVTSPLSIYLTEGTHTITLYSQREPMMLRKIILSNSDEVKSYEEQLAEWDNSGATDTTGVMQIIQGEDADRKSSQMLYPQQDTSSPSVDPYNVKLLTNNYIGGNSWKSVGDWLEWDFTVEQSGYYYISMHDRQNLVKGIYVSRNITIDGENPFEELDHYGFTYNSKWRLDTLSDSEGTPYKIYLEAGTHTIRMQAVLGDFSDVISDVQEVVTQLNSIYREVIKITGTDPVSDRDYQLESYLPNLTSELEETYDLLDETITNLRALVGTNSDKETTLKTMLLQLKELIKDNERFPIVLASFKVNLRALGNWIVSAVEQPLSIDKIYIYSPDMEVEDTNTGFFAQLVHEIKKLYYSFIIDYNQIGNVAEDDEEQETITVWIGTGRDQANVIKGMIDDTFTPDSNISVNVQLVDMSTLLKATLAGSGPDVAIQVSSTNTGTTTGTNVSCSADLPVNYGIRHAVADLSQFDDLDEVLERFTPASITAFQFDGATYALPETFTFPVMFYRKDILSEIGLELPTTWDEMEVAMSVLNNNQMELAMIPGEQIFATLLAQYGGEYYNEDGSKSLLDNDEGITAFRKYCELYTDYELDRVTSVDQRFRIGEAPIMIADFSVYNNLQVSAPDIKGLWGIAPIPGVLKEDGTINNTSIGTGLASVIMESSEHKEAAWEFLKWWSSTDVQIKYGNEMESLMGASARVATANSEAFTYLNWTKSDYNALFEQLENVEGIRQVPGGYYTWRNINNAFYAVTQDDDDAEFTTPREELTEKVLLINDELTYKRKEFDLPLADE